MEERLYGVTPPISTNLPTEQEKRLHHALHDELRAQGTFESPAETEQREIVIAQLEKITNAFVKRAAKEKWPKNTILIRDAIGRVFTYGSYRLGVYGPGSDMDTLVVAPKYVTVEQYFKIFPEVLVQMAPKGAITDLTPVPDAFVPIIKFEFSGISIDLIFCSIQTLQQLPSEKNWSLADNNLLRGLSENEVRSLNGTRVTDDILNLVPEPATFKLALRAIKLWAQRRAIYANIMGYPGGVAWAMMVARVCQLYPKATSAVVVNKFFHIMHKWPWPLPVLLKDIEYNISVTRTAVWNPKIYNSDRNHKMPIITPAYPAMCATHNIGNSSMTIILKELEMGIKVTDEIMGGKRPWKDLFAKHTFFTSGFKYYLTVITSSRNKKAQNAWSGLIESKVRVLVNKLEMHHMIALARPFNKGYDRVHRCKNDKQLEEVISLGSLAYQYKPTPEEEKAEAEAKAKAEAEEEAKAKAEVEAKIKTEEMAENGDGHIKTENGDEDSKKIKLEEIEEKKVSADMEVFTTNYYIGLQFTGNPKALDLSREVNDWKAMCLNHPIYQEDTMFLSVQHLRNIALPDDVFEPGEEKPKPVKKQAKRPAGDVDGSQGVNRQVKRPAVNDDGSQGVNRPAKRQQTTNIG
ncbi:Poly(A) polymerase pla1 [Podospora fimiseda]|uniref:Poly(A) polymerase n=1 Tax=Podospora fimiseda TaxID=252190 RepID=A0AAN6YMR3_9PEZI|nr:Poly(A) polymerase pla1 [Podospora fimiseda]